MRMLGIQGPAQPSPTLGDAINAGFGYLEVKCLGCNTHQTATRPIANHWARRREADGSSSSRAFASTKSAASPPALKNR
jgi:hypothetical protein